MILRYYDNFVYTNDYFYWTSTVSILMSGDGAG